MGLPDFIMPGGRFWPMLTTGMGMADYGIKNLIALIANVGQQKKTEQYGEELMGDVYGGTAAQQQAASTQQFAQAYFGADQPYGPLPSITTSPSQVERQPPESPLAGRPFLKLLMATSPPPIRKAIKEAMAPAWEQYQSDKAYYEAEPGEPVVTGPQSRVEQVGAVTYVDGKPTKGGELLGPATRVEEQPSGWNVTYSDGEMTKAVAPSGNVYADMSLEEAKEAELGIDDKSLIGQWNTFLDWGKAEVAKLGESQHKAIDKAYQRLGTQTQQSLVDRGLWNTSVADTMTAGVERERADAHARTDEALTTMNLQFATKITGEKLSTQERGLIAQFSANQDWVRTQLLTSTQVGLANLANLGEVQYQGPDPNVYMQGIGSVWDSWYRERELEAMKKQAAGGGSMATVGAGLGAIGGAVGAAFTGGASIPLTAALWTGLGSAGGSVYDVASGGW